MAQAEIEETIRALEARNHGPVVDLYSDGWKPEPHKVNHIVSHGTQQELDGQNPATVAELLVKHGLEPLSTIKLVACSVGSNAGFAKRLEEEFRDKYQMLMIVKATSGLVHYTEKDKYIFESYPRDKPHEKEVAKSLRESDELYAVDLVNALELALKTDKIPIDHQAVKAVLNKLGCPALKRQKIANTNDGQDKRRDLLIEFLKSKSVGLKGSQQVAQTLTRLLEGMKRRGFGGGGGYVYVYESAKESLQQRGRDLWETRRDWVSGKLLEQVSNDKKPAPVGAHGHQKKSYLVPETQAGYKY
jgi:hypothetical protein